MRARHILGWSIVGQLGFLAITGVYLYFQYRPSSSPAWFDVPAGLDPEVKAGRVVRALHAGDAWLVILSAVALLVLVAVEGVRSRSSLVKASGVLVLAVAALSTGVLLPWDQLALAAVTVGTNLSGYRAVFNGEVRFVLIDGAEVSASTIRWWFVLHVVIGLVALGIATWLVVAHRGTARLHRSPDLDGHRA